jgi:hypothetical protein
MGSAAAALEFESIGPVAEVVAIWHLDRKADKVLLVVVKIDAEDYPVGLLIAVIVGIVGIVTGADLYPIFLSSAAVLFKLREDDLDVLPAITIEMATGLQRWSARLVFWFDISGSNGGSGSSAAAA